MCLLRTCHRGFQETCEGQTLVYFRKGHRREEDNEEEVEESKDEKEQQDAHSRIKLFATCVPTKETEKTNLNDKYKDGSEENNTDETTWKETETINERERESIHLLEMV